MSEPRRKGEDRIGEHARVLQLVVEAREILDDLHILQRHRSVREVSVLPAVIDAVHRLLKQKELQAPKKSKEAPRSARGRSQSLKARLPPV